MIFEKRTFSEIFIYCVSIISRNLCLPVSAKALKKKYLKKNQNGETYFDFKGAKLPDITDDPKNMMALAMIFDDSFRIPCLYGDNHDKSIIEKLEFNGVYFPICYEGPYGYSDGKFDVTIKPGDVVIDAGAWIGDFSAYVAAKGAVAYAFEPVQKTFQLLCETAKLNEGEIYPIRKGLGNKEEEIDVFINETLGGGDSIINNKGTLKEKVVITTLDKFVEENNITKIDFIKADIEGAERDMLHGAVNVLKKFSPKLAICTYHLSDDPETLEKIILEANQKYKIVHIRKKLFASI
ncbi:hypothetical protein AGMMS49940_11910 [Spirochaetia bacterium]|nr:hypothetical protein AGMMS49940_11910 [Spirochaetia bacterium]